MRKRSLFNAFCLGTLAAVLGLFSVSQADDWLHWRGPSHLGISSETGVVHKWKFDSDKVLWKSEIGGRATPIVLNDRVYLNCRTKNDFNDPIDKVNCRQQVVCWDAKTGKELWKDVFNVFLTDIPAPRVGWASMCGDKETGNVYCYTVDGIFRCYNGETGKVVWQHSMLEEYGAISGYGGRTQTPIISEDLVIVSTLAANWGEYKGPGPKQYYFAMDKRTGKLQWISGPGAAPVDTNQSIPFIAVFNGQRMLVGGNSNGSIYALNARTGKKIWEFKLSKRGLNATATTDGKYVYIAHGEDNIDNDKFGRVQCIDPTGTGDVTETHGKWRFDGLKAGFCGLTVKDGILYVISDTGNLNAFEAESGKKLWVHDLGTVGKGSPVWVEGYLHVAEVNGNIYTLKPTREGCETINHVELRATSGEGADEIYASPAISNGRVFWVTRDRTFCVGTKDDAQKSKPFTLPKEADGGKEIDLVQLRPYEVVLREGDTAEYEIVGFNKLGQVVEKKKATIKIGGGLDVVSADGNKITVGNAKKDYAGTISAELGGKTATARVRVMPSAGHWKWTFDGFKGIAVPPTWIRAHIKMKPKDLAGNIVMRMGPGKGRPSHMTWIGTPEMKHYTITSEVYMTEQQRRLASVGITNQRYNLVLDGNNGELQIRTWQPHLRMAKTIDFEADPEVWYKMKLVVDIKDGVGTIRGKVWEKGKDEPEKWTIEATDPHPNKNGAPGVYVYGLADCYFDNIEVTPRK